MLHMDKAVVHFADFATSWIRFTTPDLIPVQEAAPSVHIPTQLPIRCF